MSQHYSDPDRERDEHALPDVEIFYAGDLRDQDGEPMEPGWYYWFCFPGCLPDSDPIGPFDSAATAEEVIRDSHGTDYGDIDIKQEN